MWTQINLGTECPGAGAFLEVMLSVRRSQQQLCEALASWRMDGEACLPPHALPSVESQAWF